MVHEVGPSTQSWTPRLPTVADSAHLDVALDALTTSPAHWVTVLDAERHVVGTVGITDIVRGYRLGLLSSLQDMDAVGDHEGTNRVHIEAGSPLVGRSLRQSEFPVSVIVTTMQRRRDLLVPDGNTVLEAGDELVIIGPAADVEAIRGLAASPTPDTFTRTDSGTRGSTARGVVPAQRGAPAVGSPSGLSQSL